MGKLKQSLCQANDDQDFLDNKYPKENPLTAAGEKTLASMKKHYGKKKGVKIFYKSINKGIPGSDKWHLKR